MQGSLAVLTCSLGMLLLIGCLCPLPTGPGSRVLKDKNISRCTPQRWVIFLLGL